MQTRPVFPNCFLSVVEAAVIPDYDSGHPKSLGKLPNFHDNETIR